MNISERMIFFGSTHDDRKPEGLARSTADDFALCSKFIQSFPNI